MTTTDRSIAASEDNPTGTRPLLTWERDPDGVVVLSVNDPALTVDTLSDPFVRDLEAVVEHLWAGGTHRRHRRAGRITSPSGA
jgi:hypothetical protein